MAATHKGETRQRGTRVLNLGGKVLSERSERLDVPPGVKQQCTLNVAPCCFQQLSEVPLAWDDLPATSSGKPGAKRSIANTIRMCFSCRRRATKSFCTTRKSPKTVEQGEDLVTALLDQLAGTRQN